MKDDVGARSLDRTEQKHGIPKLGANIQNGRKDRAGNWNGGLTQQDKLTEPHQGLFEPKRKGIVNGAILICLIRR